MDSENNEYIHKTKSKAVFKIIREKEAVTEEDGDSAKHSIVID